MILTRRKLIGGIGLLVAAPAIVRASSIMPVKSLAHLEGGHVYELFLNPGGISYIRNGGVLPDGTLKFGVEFAGQYTEWATPDHIPLARNTMQFRTITWLGPLWNETIPTAVLSQET